MADGVRSLSEILADTLAIAETQLEAARTLDVPALNEATALRGELAFELQIALEGKPDRTADVEELVFQLTEIDDRLQTILIAGAAAIERLRSADLPETYTSEGRLKRSSP